ncbi:MAG: histidine phosphatase family protein [Calothrix sp. SM1_5_4]|nr:histidine phosphatase family protein [Calothrix sp. SM1_5_4]
MVKTLILIRHAHRDTTRRELDNGLDEKGREQARFLKRFFSERFSVGEVNSGLWLVSSPKLRCVETLLPLARSLERPVDIHPELSEQAVKESRQSLERRVHAFLHEWTNSSIPLTLLCSHGDWLPVAVYHLLGLRQEFKKGAVGSRWSGTPDRPPSRATFLPLSPFTASGTAGAPNRILTGIGIAPGV